jgi:M6 family metalloprotease-like protein
MKWTIMLLMILSVSLFAIPAKRTPTLMTQPDGAQFSLVGFGDERYSYAETLDGYVVVQGTDNYWYYAILSLEGKYSPSVLRVGGNANAAQVQALLSIPKYLKESKNVISDIIQKYERENFVGSLTTSFQTKVHRLMKTATTVRHVLVLCVKYSDIPNTYTSQSFQDMINNDTWKSGIGGMSKYYKEVSYNTLSIQADYQDWITAANTSSYYAKNNANYSAHVKELVKQCIDAAKANGVNFANYDNDGDGVVDGVFILHAGKGAEEGSDNNYIWSHQGSISSYTLSYDGKTFDKYIVLPEKYNGGHVDIGVFCHEYGHVLGLPDTYDTDGATNGGSEGVGQWCVMAGGSWGGDGASPERPVHMSAWCKNYLGFTVPTVVNASQALSIPQAETNSFNYKIWMDNNQSDEYMLIENRQKTGFDSKLPGSGLLIYHIDQNLSDIWPFANEINVTNTHLGIKVYEADNLEEMSAGVNRGNAGDPYPGTYGKTSLTASTSPNSKLWNGISSGVEISNISATSATITATAIIPIYYGYNQQFYRKFAGLGYTNTYNYGMVKCTPTQTGKLVGVRVISPASEYASVSAAAFTSFSSNTLGSQVGSTVSGASGAITNFIQLNFSPAIDVTQNIPIYVRIQFQPTTGYFVPVDASSPATGNSYISANATSSFVKLTAYDIPVRVVFQTIPPPPASPLNLTTNAGNAQVTLRWNMNTETDFLKYRIYMGTDSLTISLKDSSIASITDTTKTITGLINGTKYYFRVSALNGARLESSKSFAVSATPFLLTVTGTVTYSSTNANAIGAVIMTLTPASGTPLTAIADASGVYSFPNVSVGTYTLTASKTGTWGGVTGGDALVLARHAAGIALLTGLPLTAADVNANGTVTGGDALLIVRRAAGLDASFTGGDWVFASQQVVVASNPVTANVSGLAMGDLNASYVPASGTVFAKDAVSLVGDAVQEVASAALFEVPVRATTEMELGSMSLKFNYPTDLVTFVGVSSKLDGLVSQANEGSVTIVWADMSAKNAMHFKVDEPLVTLKFSTKAVKGTVDLTLDSWSELTSSDGALLSTATLSAPSTEFGNIPSVFSLGQNYPNPFNPSTTIQYGLPLRSTVRLIIYNVLGQVVKELINTEQSAGYQSVIWNAPTASGIYFYRIEATEVGNANNRFVGTKRMMLLK